MGLFDMFGVGGGRLAIAPQSPHVAAGGAVAGTVGFQGGSRAQQVTNITVKLVMDQTTLQPTQQGPRPSTQTRDVVPAHPIAVAFTSTPGQAQQFAFELRIPPGVPNSTPGQVKYRIVASADIDGEIDPGAHCEIQVVGGVAVSAAPSAVMPVIGTPVLAQWRDGAWHSAMVVAVQNGMIGVDWTDPALGASSWLHPAQLQPHAHPGAPAAPPVASAPFHPAIAKAQPPAKANANANANQASAKPHEPGKPFAHEKLAIGAHVVAQWHDGHWHPARVVAMQNGSLGVDWDDPALGQSSWVQPHQVRAR